MKNYTSVKKNIIKHILGNGEIYFTVDFVTSVYKKFLGISRVNEDVIHDEEKFYHESDAEIYAKYSIAPGHKICLSINIDGANYCITTGMENFKLMQENDYRIFTTKISLGSYLFTHFSIDEIRRRCASPELLNAIEQYYDSLKRGYVSITNKSEYQIYFIAKSNFAKTYTNCCELYMSIIAFSDKADIQLYEKLEQLYSHKTDIVSSITSFDYGTVKSMNQLNDSRNTLIDEEISRIDKYKEFLLTLKK